MECVQPGAYIPMKPLSHSNCITMESRRVVFQKETLITNAHCSRRDHGADSLLKTSEAVSKWFDQSEFPVLGRLETHQPENATPEA